MEVALMFALFVGIVAIVGTASHHFAKKRRAAWRTVAGRLGLAHQENLIKGTFQGVPLVVSIVLRGPESKRSEHTHFMMDIEGKLPAGLSITAEGVFNKIAKLVGSQDVQLGLHRLDSKLSVRAQEESEVYNWARRIRVQEGLGQLVEIKNGSFSIAKNKLTFEHPAAIGDAGDLERYIRDLTTVASNLSELPSVESSDSLEVSEDEGAVEALW
jgi:hypothetical protein